MRTYIRVVSALSRAAGFFSCLLLLAAVVVVTHMVVVRYLLQSSTIWQTEFVTYALVAATFLGSAYVLLLKGHVAIDILPNLAGPRARRVLDAVNALLCLLFCALLGWSSWHFFHEALVNGWKTPTIWKLPLWIPLLPLPLGLALLFLQYLAELLRPRVEAAR
jgi:TRAP-type C4-dicarboxylate transport system permease small subunit